METVQLQCGHCQQVIAIGVEHLGGQVQCPHCQGVLQTPPRPAQPAPPPVSPIPNMESHQRESIFAGAEASDSVLGESAEPKVEMPPSDGNELPSATPAPEPDADLTKFKPRPVFDRSVISLYALIFLVPYAILTTIAVLYFVFVQSAAPRTHPFDMLPDPAPGGKQGGPKKVSFKIDPTHTLAEHQKVALGKSIRVGKDGDLEVTAEKIRLMEDGELKLYLRAKNTSENIAFKPTDDSYLRFNPEKMEDRPYTFLETPSNKVNNIYGASLAYRKNLQNDEDGRESLGPRDETILVLTTTATLIPSQKPFVDAIAAGTDSHVWRVQLRRGFVKYRGKDVSATAVIGVEFTGDQIERGKKS